MQVGTVADFPRDQGTVLVVDGQEIGVYNISGEFFAYDNHCLHQGGPVCAGRVMPKVEWVLGEDKRLLAQRFAADEMHFVCPWHGWEYDVRTGECVTDRRLRVRRYPVSVRGDAVYVTL